MLIVIWPQPHLGYFQSIANRLQLCIKKCCSLVEIFSRSWKKTCDLRNKQEQLNLPYHKLVSDVCTRWGSTYEMASRVVEQQNAVCSVLADDRKYWCKMSSEEELSTIESVVKVVEPLSYFIRTSCYSISCASSA